MKWQGLPSFIATENVKRKTTKDRVATSNVDTGCVEEKVSCLSVFIDLSVVSISGRCRYFTSQLTNHCNVIGTLLVQRFIFQSS